MRRRTFIRSALAAAATVAIPQHQLLAALYQPLRQDVPDIPAITGDGREVTLNGRDIADLGARLRGQLLLAGDSGYEEARQILNPSFDKRPALIARVAGAADVRAAVDFARDHGGLLLAVKCGGHSFSGASTCDGGLLIDLSPHRNVRVDPAARRAWVTGGSLLGHVDYETMSYGLVAPFGTVSHTGVGGLVTQGGFGRLGRRFGLSVDNLESVQVVTADGRLLTANAEENEDLFWGVRGGGGNFGVVTNFEFRLHPMQQQVVGGHIMFPLEVAREALALYADYGASMPDELYADLSLTLPPGGQPGAVGFSICYSGPESEAEKALAPIRALGKPLSDGIKSMDYVALQRSGDYDDPRATGVYLKSGFLDRLSPGIIEALLGKLEGHPERVTQIAFQHSGGAIGRVDPLATAFAQRDAKYNILGITAWPHGPGVDAKPHMDYMRGFWRDIEPHTHGFYTADMVPDISQEQVRANFRANHERLVAVKNRYDPTNLFRLNANVKPTVKTQA
jgi:FAD/FMN-containing dehydrogenase